MPLYVDQGSGTKLFLLPDNIKAICFVLWNVRSTGEIAKRSHNCDVGERHEQQTEEESSHNGIMWGKRKTRGEREMKQRELGDKEQTEVWSCKGNKRKREWDRVGRRVKAETGWTDGCRQWGRSFPWPSLWPIRIKLAGPWQRLGRTVGHEERGGGGGGTKGGEYSGD